VACEHSLVCSGPKYWLWHFKPLFVMHYTRIIYEESLSRVLSFVRIGTLTF